MQPPAVSLPQEAYIPPLENRAIQLWPNNLLSVPKSSATMSPTSSVNGTSPTVRSDAAYPASRMGRDGHERATERRSGKDSRVVTSSLFEGLGALYLSHRIRMLSQRSANMIQVL